MRRPFVSDRFPLPTAARLFLLIGSLIRGIHAQLHRTFLLDLSFCQADEIASTRNPKEAG
jgi:hypothetical protein